MIKHILDENQYLEVVQKYLVCTRNVNEKESVYFKEFWPQVQNICRAGFYRMATFSEQLLPTASEYSMFFTTYQN